MYSIDNIKNKIINGDVLEVLKKIPNESIDVCITSPPYWKLRDYGVDGQLGDEDTYDEYIEKLIEIYTEVYRVLKPKGSCWVNIGDVYASDNRYTAKKHSLIGIPDRFKVKMIDSGWLCRNEIIWHKPNAMPCSAKTRFNNDFEKMFFFTKNDSYYFNTQYEPCKSPQINATGKRTKNKASASKYVDEKQESSVRQGMNKQRGLKLIEKRNLPEQSTFVKALRENFTISELVEKTGLSKTTIEHWFRYDASGFSYPSKEAWSKLNTHLFPELLESWFETDDINKNIHKGRIKRAVWSINTKGFKGAHFAPFPEELIRIPIEATCPDNGVVLDIFMGSGTTGAVAKKLNRNFIGIELNPEYIKIAEERILNS